MSRILLRAVVLSWLTALVVLPLAAVVVAALRGGPGGFIAAVTSSIAIDALLLTLWTAALVTLFQAVLGTWLAFVLVRARVLARARRVIDAALDLPFALPTLLPGLAILVLFGPRAAIGSFFEVTLGVRVAFAQPAIVLVLVFLTLPFVVRAVEPVLRSLDESEEEAAATLGASRARVFTHVLLPALLPAIGGGALQAFARCLAEFGSVVVVSGNVPHATLTAPALVYREVEGGRLDVAAAISVVLLLLAALALGLVRVVVHHGRGARA